MHELRCAAEVRPVIIAAMYITCRNGDEPPVSAGFLFWQSRAIFQFLAEDTEWDKGISAETKVEEG